MLRSMYSRVRTCSQVLYKTEESGGYANVLRTPAAEISNLEWSSHNSVQLNGEDKASAQVGRVCGRACVRV